MLLLMYSATRKVLTILHDATLGTITREVVFSWCGTIATLVHRHVEDHEGSGPQRTDSLCHHKRLHFKCWWLSHGVLASLDGTTQNRKLVEQQRSVLERRYLLFFTFYVRVPCGQPDVR